MLRKGKSDHKGSVKRGLMGMIIVLCRLFCVLSEPLLLGAAFLGLLFNRAMWIGIRRGFIGLVLFIVYVGGTMVLFTYCLMLSPLQFFSREKKLYSVALVIRGGLIYSGVSIGIYEFFNFGGILLIVGILLFIVILSVVELIDFARGALRVECDALLIDD